MKKTNNNKKEEWFYSDVVKKHFLKPQNFIAKEPKLGDFDAQGEAGSVVCGDVMKVWFNIDKKTEKIKNFKWQTWGCASAISATSMFSVMVTEKGGMKLSDALKIKPQDIITRLHGLPARKVHCSVLVDQAFKNAAGSYKKQGLTK